MYKVVKFFTDLTDMDHPYHEGDTFPRDGVTVSKERIAELSGTDNKQGVRLIEPVEVPRRESVGEEAAAPKKRGRRPKQ